MNYNRGGARCQRGRRDEFRREGDFFGKRNLPPAPSPKKSYWVLYLIPSKKASRRGSFCRKSADLFTLIGFFLGERENLFSSENSPSEKLLSPKWLLFGEGLGGPFSSPEDRQCRLTLAAADSISGIAALQSGFFLGERENPFSFPKEKGFSQKLSIVSRGGRIGP